MMNDKENILTILLKIIDTRLLIDYINSVS